LKPVDEEQNRREFDAIRIMTGFAKTQELFLANSRPIEATLLFKGKDNAWSETITLDDSPDPQTYTLSRSFSFNQYSVGIRIDRIAQGTRWDDICIAELKFLEVNE
jgi:hypothetical protein